MIQHPLGVRQSVTVREPTPEERAARVVTVVVLSQATIMEEVLRRRIALRSQRATGLLVRHLAREYALAYDDAVYRLRQSWRGGSSTIKKSSGC